jgi:hypothetical protein
MIKLYINKFKCENRERANEYEYCLERNEENPLIDEIVLIKSDERPSYAQAFDLMSDDSINILANSDIYFDETLQFVKTIDKREFWCLTRWELLDGEIMFFSHRNKNKYDHSKWSQDIWICNGKPVIPQATFQMGVPGCDNKIALLAFRAGYAVKNPSYTIRGIHVHRNDWRPKRDAERIPPPYKWVQPSTLR